MATLMSNIVAAGHTAADLTLTDYLFATQTATSDQVLAATVRQVRRYIRPDFAPPAASAFTIAINDGTAATITDTTSGTIVNAGHATGSTAADAIRGVFRSISGSPWHATARIRATLNGENYSAAGLALANSTNSKLITFALRGGGVNTGMDVNRYNSATAYASGIVDVPWVPHIEWLKIGYDGANLNFYVSGDGVTWMKIAHEAATSFMGVVPDRVGLIVDVLGGSTAETDFGVNCLYYEDSGYPANY